MPKSSPAKLAQVAKWRAANPEKVRAYARHYASKPELRKRRNATMARWRKNNAERVKENYRRRRAADPEGWKRRHRSAKLKINYGITMADYDRMLTEQKGACAICGGTQDKAFPWRLVVDHDKDTGRVRQLLCSPCNLGLGSFTHNPQTMRSAVAYLEKHKEEKCK